MVWLYQGNGIDTLTEAGMRQSPVDLNLLKAKVLAIG